MATAQPVSVRLDDDVRRTLERDAAQHGVGLATYLRELATDRAKAVRKAEIRTQSRLVGERTRSSREAHESYQSVGTPSAEI
ncbi:MAG: hypothetical protein ACYDEW_04025 [Vulcanimicrobiaceae bacterium]